MKNNEIKPSELVIEPQEAEVILPTTTIAITVEEYTRLKDIETRFAIMREQMLHSDYCAIHHQVILGIEKEYAQKTKELQADMFPGKWDPLKK